MREKIIELVEECRVRAKTYYKESDRRFLSEKPSSISIAKARVYDNIADKLEKILENTE